MEKIFSFSKLLNLFFSLCTILAMYFFLPESSTQAVNNPFNFTASVNAELQMTISGGNNEKGKRTMLISDAIQFGKVSFVTLTPITGDSYLNDGSLMLEAIIDTSIVFNGTSLVNVKLTKLDETSNSFHEIYYSLSKARLQSLEKVLTSPVKNSIKTIRKSTNFPIRVVFEIAPEQKGDFYDRLKLEVTSI